MQHPPNSVRYELYVMKIGERVGGNLRGEFREDGLQLAIEPEDVRGSYRDAELRRDLAVRSRNSDGLKRRHLGWLNST